ncbi:hypothetical protein CRG98_033869 [Punica granatum]|uniref:Uncharacterized protein n=1 Tax=Punica granatum TaxID=22663 RepID=A0A2I0IQN1_PUNGR|nr:hypothetical protein CRG98_033869 [Punica granatum]
MYSFQLSPRPHLTPTTFSLSFLCLTSSPTFVGVAAILTVQVIERKSKGKEELGRRSRSSASFVGISNPDPSIEVASVLRGYRRPRWRGRGRRLAARKSIKISDLKSPVSFMSTGDLNGGVEVADWRPQSANRFRTSTRSPRSIGLAAPTLPTRSSASSVSTGDLGGGVAD